MDAGMDVSPRRNITSNEQDPLTARGTPARPLAPSRCNMRRRLRSHNLTPFTASSTDALAPAMSAAVTTATEQLSLFRSQRSVWIGILVSTPPVYVMHLALLLCSTSVPTASTRPCAQAFGPYCFHCCAQIPIRR